MGLWAAHSLAAPQGTEAPEAIVLACCLERLRPGHLDAIRRTTARVRSQRETSTSAIPSAT